MASKNKTSTLGVKSMIKTDGRRMFTMPLVYIMIGICFVVPILILVMTTMMPSSSFDPVTGEEIVSQTFTNVWQAFGSLPIIAKARPNGGASASASQMDITSMCNINMLYFAVAVFGSIFIAQDFKSGYAKNLFTSRSKKSEYLISKTVCLFFAAVIMFIVYFIGAMVGGAIARLSFSTEGFGVFGIVMCMIAKIFATLIFVSITVAVSVSAKQKLWLSILGSCAAGMLLYTMIPMVTPLNSTPLNVVLCAAGGGLFAFALGAVSNTVLKRTSLA